MRLALPLAAALVAALLVPLPPPSAGAAGEAPLRVLVRVETPEANAFRGWVDVPATTTVVAYNSGRAHVLHGASPLAALVRAAEAGGFVPLVTDEFLGVDFSVDAVEGHWQAGTRWWDFRVNHVATYYGMHVGWHAHGPGLRTGDEVLWYMETVGTTPLRLRHVPVGPGPEGTCAYALRADVVAPDVQHRAGAPWPTPSWAPVPWARLAGDAAGPVAGGVSAVAVPPGGATLWADAAPLPAANLDLVRSDRVRLPCAAG